MFVCSSFNPAKAIAVVCGKRSAALVIGLCLLQLSTGCALAPDAKKRERFHNPLPQLHRIAVLPFFNQSGEPTLDEIAVAESYYAELQAIPGFEVLPIGVSTNKWREYQVYPGLEVNGDSQVLPSTFQAFAQYLGVDAVVVGSVTDYSPYSPPRFALTTRWYAANQGFHPVPVGYGLPWGTKAEKKIPRRILLETELEVARAQLATQTPQASTPGAASSEGLMAEDQIDSAVGTGVARREDVVQLADGGQLFGRDQFAEASHSQAGLQVASLQTSVQGGVPVPVLELGDMPHSGSQAITGGMIDPMTGNAVVPLPANWPDPTQLIPDPPSPLGPSAASPQSGPVLTHTRIYRGDDPDVTEKLADYVYARDDGRLGGWQGYLTRSDDFIRFCCYLHITEMLEMRGGRDKSDLIFRWPISRYSR